MMRHPMRKRSAKGIAKEKAREAVYRTVRARDRYQCRAKVKGVCTRDYEHIHHKLPRSAGGGDTEDNLICICGACHDFIHRNPERAYELGLLISRYPEGQ